MITSATIVVDRNIPEHRSIGAYFSSKEEKTKIRNTADVNSTISFYRNK
jgi:hypothetical protein